ncbi:F-box only protein 21-like isoform X1 [Montipora foliosa]|uniref:F-box only protein 21-like isoform X1 n=2 Tax=Montipora foliosa TaxID=591990 RepID=UPI0035F18351
MSPEIDEMSLLLLADELIDMVFSYSFIDHKDLCRCAQVCRRLNVVATGNELWKKKALSRWHVWKTSSIESWMDVFRDRLLTEIKIRRALQFTAVKYHRKIEVCKKDLDSYVLLGNGDSSFACYMDDTLCELLQGDVCKVNLTHRYYARKVQSHLKVHQLKSQWEKYLALPDNQQHLEKGALLIARWILNEEDIDEQSILLELDNIAQMVQQSLHGNRSVINSNSTSPLEERIARRTKAIPAVTHPAATLRILDCLKHVLYQQLQFKGNVDEYYRKENSLLHEVLNNRCGNPITLSVLFAAVARRIGVSIEPVNFPSHFLLRWKTNLDPEAADETAYKYIDCFNGGRFLSKEQCLEMLYMENSSSSNHNFFDKATPRQVFIRMVANIINSYRTLQQNNRLTGLHSALDLALFLDPNDEDSRFLLVRTQVHLGIDLEEAIKSCQEILNGASLRKEIARSLLEQATVKKNEEDCADNTYQPKLRTDPRNSEVQFKVGMVMRHKLYHYGCVIFGWDPVCQMDESWIQRMSVDNLPNGGRNQPFYNVLGDDCTQRYAAHVNLREDPNQPFNPHPEIGKYFKGFNGTRYIPNECVRQQYPDDVETED